MTIDEIIRLLREIDGEEREEAYTAIFPPYADDCIERAENCKKIADWLEEFKEYRDMNIVHCKDCKHWGTGVAGETENVKCCEYGKYMVGKHGFCCYAEKECTE